MSVIEPKRKIASMEYYQNAERIFDTVSDLLIREFGIRKKIHTYKIVNDKLDLTDEEVEEINKILESHNTNFEYLKFAREIPKIFLEEDQKNVYNKCYELLDCIVMANSMFPNNFAEYMMREAYLKRAIACCKSLSNHIMRIIRFHKIPIKKFVNLSDLIEKEIKLLIGVRKSDKERFPDYESAIKKYYPHDYYSEDNIEEETKDDTKKLIIEDFEKEIINDFVRSDKIEKTL